MAIKAIYKRYNGTSWDEIAFATLTSQITDDSTAKWFMTTSNTVNGKAFSKGGGITLESDDLNLSSSADSITATYHGMNCDLSSKMNITDAFAKTYDAIYNLYQEKEGDDEAIRNRLAVLESAYSSGTIITTTNMGDKITKVGTITSGTWQGTAIADSYIASASKWNQGISDLSALQTTVTNNKTELDERIDTVAAIAQGKTTTYVIDSSSDTSGSENAAFFILQTASVDQTHISASGNTGQIKTVNGEYVQLSSLQIGDIILTKEANVKDFYLGLKADSTYIFYEIDSDKPDLTDYATTSAVTSAISSAIQALDSSKDAGSGNYLQSITITDGKITGGTVGTIPTSLPASNVTDSYSASSSGVPISGKGVSAALSQAVSKTATGNGITVSLGGTVQSPTVAVSAAAGSVASGNSNVVSGGTVYSHVANRATKIYYADSASTVTGMIAGDICIEY